LVSEPPLFRTTFSLRTGLSGGDAGDLIDEFAGEREEFGMGDEADVGDDAGASDSAGACGDELAGPGAGASVNGTDCAGSEVSGCGGGCVAAADDLAV
jgi:hypothetical protein